MTRFLLFRLTVLPLALLAAHLFGFAYAYTSITPYSVRTFENRDPLLPAYLEYLEGARQLEFGTIGTSGEGVVGRVASSLTASLGLLGIAFAASVTFGLLLGFIATRNDPPGVASWLGVLATGGLAMPAFYLGSLFIVATFYFLILSGPGSRPPLPLQGFGWDLHLVLPSIVLMARPTVQIAQLTAEMLSGELGKFYIKVARSYGHNWRDIRRRLALRNVLVPIVLTVTASLRVMIGELIVVEWLFAWPGLGRQLVLVLVSDVTFVSPTSPLLFHPPLTAAIVAVFAGLFLFADFGAALLSWLLDPFKQQEGAER